jgi:N-acetyl sugar amidotransferase
MTAIYKICTRCVMDTSDPDITFNDAGVCNHCLTYEKMMNKLMSRGNPQAALDLIVSNIKHEGKGKEYDCIIGVSGGVDSTFLAYKVKQMGLRPLAVHLDNGWDSELAVSNIQKVLEKLNIDLHTHVINWEEFCDLQLSFLKSSTPDSEIPSDHAIFSLMHQMAKRIKVRYILTGVNLRTETHMPAAWSRGHLDWRYIKSVQKQFGSVPLNTFPHMNIFTRNWYLLTQKSINILDFLDYRKNDTMKILENELGWRYYGGKHYESIYTRFYQGYILPRKFGYDKRRAHLSSLICSGEIRRDQALEDLKVETYPKEMQAEDREYVVKKLNINEAEFDQIMNLPKKTYWDYPSYGDFERNIVYRGIRSIYRAVQ